MSTCCGNVAKYLGGKFSTRKGHYHLVPTDESHYHSVPMRLQPRLNKISPEVCLIVGIQFKLQAPTSRTQSTTSRCCACLALNNLGRG
eukprot:scaffold24846_cov124-Skeletonema_marinoi.AAC.3